MGGWVEIDFSLWKAACKERDPACGREIMKVIAIMQSLTYLATSIMMASVFAKLFAFRRCLAEKQAYFYFSPWYLAEIPPEKNISALSSGGNLTCTINFAT
jgi:hypothetical protein